MESGWGSDSAPAVPSRAVRPGAGMSPKPNHGAAGLDVSTDGWMSVEDHAGSVSLDDWGTMTGGFESDGTWKQA